MKFTKMHGIGNDYVYVDCFKERVPDPKRTAIAISDRHFGVGSDGLILIEPSEVADVRMRMFNADGGESEMCGNGIRCVAKYAFDHGLSKSNPMKIETGRGVLTVAMEVEAGTVRRATVNMGRPILEAEKIPTTLPGPQVIDFPFDPMSATPISERVVAPRTDSIGVGRIFAARHDRLRFAEAFATQVSYLLDGTESAVFTGDGSQLLAHVRPGESDESKRDNALTAFRQILLPCVQHQKNGAIEITGSSKGANERGPQYVLVVLLSKRGAPSAVMTLVSRAKDSQAANRKLHLAEAFSAHWDMWFPADNGDNGNIDPRVTCVSMGNPHAIFFCDDLDSVPLTTIGPTLETASVFPKRINAHWVQVHSRDEVTMRTWERGSGVTLACGTGASAVCVAGVLTNRTDRKILAHLPGGDLTLEWREDDDCVYKTGPAVEVFTGEWNPTSV